VFWRGLLVRELSEKAKVTANEIKNKIGKKYYSHTPFGWRGERGLSYGRRVVMI
jgi:hypothetical protein